MSWPLAHEVIVLLTAICGGVGKGLLLVAAYCEGAARRVRRPGIMSKTRSACVQERTDTLRWVARRCFWCWLAAEALTGMSVLVQLTW